MSNQITEIIADLEDAARHPNKTVRTSMENTGKRAVGFFPYYMPEEIIYAAGMLPVGLFGGQTEIKLADRYLQSFCCSIMRENLEQGIRGMYDFLDAVMIPTYCDTLKCVCENWKVAVPNIPLLPIVYPQNRKTDAGMRYMISEFERVKKELEKISGTEITEDKLAESLQIYEDYRKTMRQFTALAGDYPVTFNARTRHLIIKAAYFMDKKHYAERMKMLIKELQLLPCENPHGIKVVATGILTEPEIVLELFVENNIAIAADDLAQESRQFRTCTDKGETVFEKMAYRIAGQKCSLLYDEAKTRGRLLIDLVKESKADGVVISMMKFCDPEEFDYPIYKKELEAANIPMLYLEIEQRIDSVEQMRTRIQSFAEMLSLQRKEPQCI